VAKLGLVGISAPGPIREFRAGPATDRRRAGAVVRRAPRGGSPLVLLGADDGADRRRPPDCRKHREVEDTEPSRVRRSRQLRSTGNSRSSWSRPGGARSSTAHRQPTVALRRRVHVQPGVPAARGRGPNHGAAVDEVHRGRDRDLRRRACRGVRRDCVRHRVRSMPAVLGEDIRAILDLDAVHMDADRHTFHPDLPGLAFMACGTSRADTLCRWNFRPGDDGVPPLECNGVRQSRCSSPHSRRARFIECLAAACREIACLWGPAHRAPEPNTDADDSAPKADEPL
jgi:hypothetical protein